MVSVGHPHHRIGSATAAQRTATEVLVQLPDTLGACDRPLLSSVQQARSALVRARVCSRIPCQLNGRADVG